MFWGKSAIKTDNQTDEQIERRLEELKEERHAEQIVRKNATMLSLFGAVMGIFFSRKWFTLSGLALPFALKPSINKWYSPMPWMRRMGMRSKKEIEAEKAALKALHS